MRIAWFSPLPPDRTGIAAYSSSLLPLLEATGLDIHRFEQKNAHDFVWRNRQLPYDLVVYQLGNSPWHAYMWAYLFHYPGLVVLHDAVLHHARAVQLFNARRVDDYRREFAFNHPRASPAAADYALEGLRGGAFYFWPMARAVVESARLVAVHNAFVAEQLRETHPGARIERIHLGVPARAASIGARDRIRRQHNIPAASVVFIAFGLMTAEKRVGPILRAFSALRARSPHGADAHLLLVGASELPSLDLLTDDDQIRNRVHLSGYIAEEQIADYLAAADVSLSLRWPTAQETSAAWATSLAASKPTIITALPHTADVPSIDAGTWRPTRPSIEPVAVSVDLLEEDAALVAAMSRLAEESELRERLGRAGHEYWKREHALGAMADDYRRVIAAGVASDAPTDVQLPAHLRRDFSELATSLAREVGVDLQARAGFFDASVELGHRLRN